MPKVRVVVVVDLSRYSDIAKELEQQLGTSAVVTLNDQILEMIYEALRRIDMDRKNIPFKYTGDGAIAIFEGATEASRFAEQLLKIAEDYNRGKQIPLAQRHFRVGIATGVVEVVEKQPENGQWDMDMAGLTIANAVRLEAACRTGEMLISSETWADLPRELRVLYADEEEVKGKRGETFRTHRRAVASQAPWELTTILAEIELTQPDVAAEPHDRHLREIIEIQRRVAEHLEKQVQLMGLYTPPHIKIQLEDVNRTIAQLTSQLKNLS